MAEEIIYNIKADSKDAEKSIDKLNKKVEGVEKASKKGKKGLGLFRKGIKGIGTAIKASGLGLLAALMASIFEVMRKNQKVLDAIETATNFIAVGFKAVSDAVTSAYNAVSESTEGFDALGKVMSGLLTIAITPLKLGFYSLKQSIQQLKVGYETMFGNDESIKQAKADLAETRLAILEVANEAVDAGKKVYNNIGEAIDEVSEGTTALVDNISKIDPKKLVDQATNMTKLGNAAAIAAAKQAGLVEEYDRQAESQRQIRDDESKSIEERKKANEELGRILKLQEEAMLKEADLQLANARAQYEVNKNQENYIALIDAETNRKGVLAQVNGFVSEQKVNQVALLKEERELINSLGESESQLALQKQKAEADLLIVDQDRINRLLEINALEREIEAERLQAIVDNENAGTQAKIDAKIALDEFLAANAEEQGQLKRELGEQEIADEQAVADAKIAIQSSALDAGVQGIKTLASLAGKNKALQASALIAESAVGIAKTIISTQAASKAIDLKYAAIPGGLALASAEKTINKVSSGISIAANVAATAKGLKALGKGGAPSASAAGGGATPRAPQFNVVGQSPASANNIADNANSQIQNSNNNPVRAYVVSTDVSSQQALDRDIEDDNSLG